MERYKLKEHVIVSHQGDNLILVNQEALKITAEFNFPKLLDLLQDGFTNQQLEKNIGLDNAKKLYKTLNNKKMLIKDWDNQSINSITENQLYYFEQFDINPNFAQKCLERASVAILGLGGFGGAILQHLVSAGVKKFMLVDYDTVSITNLNRQYTYTRDSLERLKTKECIRYVKSIQPDADIQVSNKKIKNFNDLNVFSNFKADLFVNAADTPREITCWTSQYASEQQIPFITGGVGIEDFFWGPFLTKESYHIGLQEYFNIKRKILSPYDRNPVKGSIGSTNAMAAAFASYDIIQFLIGLEPRSFEKRLKLNLRTMDLQMKLIVNEVEKYVQIKR